MLDFISDEKMAGEAIELYIERLVS